MKKVSLQFIANSLNISKSTISLVLNGRGDEKRVSKETQEKIFKFAKAHNYKANLLARSLSRGKSDMIGLVVPNISDSFYAQIARSIEKYAERCGYNVIFCSTGENKANESKLIQSMMDRQVDGLIIASCQKNEDDIKRLKAQNFPFVLIDRHYPEIESNYVIIDNELDIRKAVEHVITLSRKRIGFVNLAPGLEAIKERLLGYKKAMQRNQLPIQKELIKELNTENLAEEMPRAIQQLLALPKGIDALVFSTHYLCAEGVRCLKQANVKIPEDIAVLSFGEMAAFDLVSPSITSVSLPSKQLGHRAVEVLLKVMEGKTDSFESIRLNGELIVRKSCGTR